MNPKITNIILTGFLLITICCFSKDTYNVVSTETKMSNSEQIPFEVTVIIEVNENGYEVLFKNRTSGQSIIHAFNQQFDYLKMDVYLSNPLQLPTPELEFSYHIKETPSNSTQEPVVIIIPPKKTFRLSQKNSSSYTPQYIGAFTNNIPFYPDLDFYKFSYRMELNLKKKNEPESLAFEYLFFYLESEQNLESISSDIYIENPKIEQTNTLLSGSYINITSDIFNTKNYLGISNWYTVNLYRVGWRNHRTLVKSIRMPPLHKNENTSVKFQLSQQQYLQEIMGHEIEIEIELDKNDYVNEPYTYNNHIRIRPPNLLFPDLIVKKITLTRPIEIRNDIWVICTLMNKGTKDVTNKSTIALNNQSGIDSNAISSAVITSLNVNEQKTVKFSINSDYYFDHLLGQKINCIVDAQKEIVESNETNNTIEFTVPSIKDGQTITVYSRVEPLLISTKNDSQIETTNVITYPNPFKNDITLSFNAIVNEESAGLLRVYDQKGILIDKIILDELKEMDNKQSILYNNQKLALGVYYYILEIDNGIKYTGTIIKN